jgi:hypothetical protein
MKLKMFKLAGSLSMLVLAIEALGAGAKWS